MTRRDNAFMRLISRPAAGLGLLVLAVVAVAAALAPFLYPNDPMSMVASPLVPPLTEAGVPLGSDQMGRDLAAGLFHGARISLMVGLCSAAAASLIGALVGGVAGYFGGAVDNVAMRLTEVFQTIPGFILAIVLVVLIGPSIATIIFAIAVVSWPPIARLTRAEFLSLRSRDFVQSCIVVGMSDARIILTQMLPNCLAPIIVMGSITVATAILTEAGLSFLGLGDPNLVSWGSMIGMGREVLRTASFPVVVPGVAIMLTVLAINLVGEGLNDALNPRLRQR
jgi:peptide/nickel transport system permease protein